MQLLPDFIPPPRKSSASPLIGVLGEPFTKEEYVQRLKALVPGFMVTHPAKVRAIVDMISKLSDRDIDIATMISRDPSETIPKKAKAAFEVVAWNTIVKPHSHSNRNYIFVDAPYYNIICQDHQYLYMYGVLLNKEPSAEIYTQLKTLHAPTAKAYRDYCRDYALATFEFENINWMFGW